MSKKRIEQVRIEVPASTGNLGLYYDKSGAAISKPHLAVILEQTTGHDIEVISTSAAPTPKGRQRGYAGKKALEQYMDSLKIKGRGLRLTYTDTDETGFRTGGTGLSGAEAVGAIVAAAVLFDQSPSERDIIFASAKAEPDGHLDNVAPSTMGGIVFLSDTSYGETLFYKVTPPKDLGLAIGFSSHQKTQGTEGTRRVLTDPVASDVFVRQVGRSVAGVLALQTGDIENFLHVVTSDGFHEPRRADAGMYGNFSASEFFEAKDHLLIENGVALSVSGAGPNMQLWYNKQRYLHGLTEEPASFITSWFGRHGINITIEEVPISEQGAYAFAQKRYPQSALALQK